ncbi:DNA-3-methyladenine glycosylase family protein [Heyndrickxia vini]|uniref:DNA-3-methyladenine glycosylase II n=1 Tax=Heyndrickxia vini TaxID=1476025 RepID=A0ABX7E049_9BACI|nr:DNA-3-methyladenine glycosylase [Heyndrickxia vini]QQZ08700.1 DNA-3-methyladenine glycosylase 2 family protein [Heyndrickxia vini]
MVKWIDLETSIDICTPPEFNFDELLVFLGRSDREILHQIKNKELYKLIKVNEKFILLKITSTAPTTVHVDFPLGTPSNREEIANYIWNWFDLNKDLKSFYTIAKKDKILSPLVEKYAGLRIIGIPDLFEALTWAIIGQQINLTFAYTLKSRLVKHFGENLEWNKETYWLHPTEKAISKLHVNDLKQLQFTTRKAEYIIDIAKAMTNGEITKEGLLQLKDFEQIHKTLMSIRGVGAWTADYVMMKCLNHPSAFPIADVGIHNALKVQLQLERKPTIEEIKQYATNWEGWQAYATFYLWRSLYV